VPRRGDDNAPFVQVIMIGRERIEVMPLHAE
jgi:hypothetical protein